MKIILQEDSHIDYQNYRFPYCLYAIKEADDYYGEIYDKGFLPYSNNLDMEEEIFYMARSIRIDLARSPFKYKQNNVFNKFSKVYLDTELVFSLESKDDLKNNHDFLDWCLANAKKRFLSMERLRYILSRPYLRNILCITSKEKVLAYVFLIHEPGKFAHVWYSFYDQENKMNDFGKWIILKTIAWCFAHQYPLFYIGTCYSASAFYKLTLSPQTTYFDGTGWNEDLSGLKKKLLTEN